MVTPMSIAVHQATKDDTSVLDDISKVGSKALQGFETTSKLISEVLSTADGLGYVQELIKAIIGTLPNPKDHIGDWSQRKIDIITNTSKTLGYFSTFLTSATVLSDIAGWFVPDDKDRYQYQRKPQHIFKKVFWNLAHWVDLIVDFKNLGIIKSSTTADAAMRIIGMIGSCARIVANASEIFISIKAIIRSHHKEKSYDLSQKRWKLFATETLKRDGTMTFEKWIAFCQAKIDGKGDDLAGAKGQKGDDFSHIKGWAEKLKDRKAELVAKGYTQEKIDADSEVKSITEKVSYWKKAHTSIKNYTAQVNAVKDDPIEFSRRCQKLRNTLVYFASNNRDNRCGKGIQIQKDSRVRELLNIILSSTVILGLALTISVQATGAQSFFGLTGKAIPKLAIALPVITCTIDLVNYVVCNLFMKKTPLKKAGNVGALTFDDVPRKPVDDRSKRNGVPPVLRTGGVLEPVRPGTDPLNAELLVS